MSSTIGVSAESAALQRLVATQRRPEKYRAIIAAGEEMVALVPAVIFAAKPAWGGEREQQDRAEFDLRNVVHQVSPHPEAGPERRVGHEDRQIIAHRCRVRGKRAPSTPRTWPVT